MGNNYPLKEQLHQLGLSADEAAIFVCLLESPKTQLDTSRATGIARSNVYRIVDGMIEKGIVHEVTTDDGRVLAGANLDALELLVVEQEVDAQLNRAHFDQLLPMLEMFQRQGSNFSVKTYTGIAGMKQMLWNELKANGEVLVFSGSSLNSATGKRWAEKFRKEVIDRGIKQRSIENTPGIANPYSDYEAYIEHYQARHLPKDLLDIQPEISIYNNTIAIYNTLTHDTRLGTEITSPFLAAFMRQIFEHFWTIAKQPEDQVK
jgi:hypothetical protein